MEKPEECPECGGTAFTLDSIQVSAHMERMYDEENREITLPFPQRELSLSISAWCCTKCDHADVDEEELRIRIQREMQKTLNKVMAELN